MIEYLDGELAPSDRRRLEDRLTTDPQLRESLQKLEESWRCLDLLETFVTDKEQVETTLEMVILDTEQAISLHAEARQRRFSWKLIVRPLALVLLFGIGVFLGERLAPDKNFFLRVASPIIERLDMYLLLYGQDEKLLPLLARQQVFLSAFPGGSVPGDLKEYQPSPTTKMLDSFTIFPNFRETRRRIDRINGLDDALFRQIYHNNERFNEFSMEKKHRLLAFHERIELSPRRYELLQTLQGYYNWRKSLQSYERAEIDQPRLSVEQRVGRIASMKKRLETNRVVHDVVSLPTDDQTLPPFEELAELLWHLDWQEQELVLNLPPEQAIPYLTQLNRNP